MNNFFDKLNTLIRVKLSDLLGDNPTTKADTSQTIAHVAKDAEDLRARVNDAIDYEYRLQTKIGDIQQQLSTLNRQADDATKQGNDAMARYFIEKIQRLQDRLATIEADLHEHQQVAQDLILKVNTLEATIADIQTAQAHPPTEEVQPPKQVTDKFSELVNDAQKRIHAVGEKIRVRKETLDSELAETPPSANMEADIEDDLARRRDRLSKK